MRRICVAAVVLVVVAVSSVPGETQPKLDLQTFFTRNIGLSQEQVTGIRNGQPVALTLQSRVPAEIFVFGAIYIHAEPEAYVKWAEDLNRLRQLPEYLGIGRFSTPPQLSDLKGFAFGSDDIAALKKCKLGNCMIQMPASRIEELKKVIDWSSPNVDQEVNELLQKTALERLIAYQKGGSQVLGQYNDKRNPTQVAEQFKYMLSYSKVLPKYLPDFYNYLVTYPEGRPANVTDWFRWENVKFGLKPTLRIIHVVTLRGSGPDEPAYAIAEKQLYSSHYFETALDLTFLIRDGHDPAKPGFYLIKAMGSEQAGLTGFKGSIVRRIAVDRSVSSLEKSLGIIKTTLESEK
jgi:hypothetical protein